MSPGRFLRTTTWRSAADEMETLPAARCPPDHPSCTQFIVKMAPLPPCSDCPGPEDKDPSLPTTRVRWQLYRFQMKVMRITWADATCAPRSRPPGPPSPRPPAPDQLNLQPEVPQQPGPHQHLGFSPQKSRNPTRARLCRLIPAISCGNKKNLFEKQTELKTQLKKESFSADFSSPKKNIDTRSQGPGDNLEGLVCEIKFKYL